MAPISAEPNVVVDPLDLPMGSRRVDLSEQEMALEKQKFTDESGQFGPKQITSRSEEPTKTTNKKGRLEWPALARRKGRSGN